ncbi:hypothetical protein Rsub_11714 [Raphidocelis subcapitata]|uniref:C2 NT-type domain-containing protein n=1 Tax=Raphidocelis subcapitata TaxID=307507 RepID=A0A2V0PIR4_9CHLO|nr:hypothetical protein Rsub_11714 [Raphidocelis subcapitata]|eukprot:GBF98922.1 hypothetical protein Rsub_11714 [Raphidocelis subcapitata]
MAPHVEGGAPGPGGAAAGGGSGLHAGRRVADSLAALRGRRAFKYEVTLIPFFASELPDAEGLGRLSLVWQRGGKVFATEPAPVNAHTRACFWSEHLRQVITVYQDGGVFAPKEYSLKVVAASGRPGREGRRTVGKARLDLAAFCDAEAEPLPKEVFLQLKPAGKLKLSVKAGWLKDAPIEPDASTEASWTTGRSGEARFWEHSDGGGGGGGDEQDLSGFGLEGAGGGGAHGVEARMVGVPLGPPPPGHDGVGGGRRPSVLGRSSQQLAAAVEAAALQARERGSSGGGGGGCAAGRGSPHPSGTPRAGRTSGAGGGGGGYAGGSPRIAALGGGVGGGPAAVDAAAAVLEEEGGGEGRRREAAKQKARVIEAAQQHVQAMYRASDEALETERAGRVGGWAPPPRRSSIWDTLCCCCSPKKKTRFIPAVPEGWSPAEEPSTLPPTTADL